MPLFGGPFLILRPHFPPTILTPSKDAMHCRPVSFYCKFDGQYRTYGRGNKFTNFARTPVTNRVDFHAEKRAQLCFGARFHRPLAISSHWPRRPLAYLSRCSICVEVFTRLFDGLVGYCSSEGTIRLSGNIFHCKKGIVT